MFCCHHHIFRFLIDERITQANEFGLIKKWESVFKVKGLPKNLEIIMNLSNDSSIFVLKLIMIVEVIVSSIIFVFEIFWHYNENDYRFTI